MSSFVNIIQDRDGTDYYLKATIPSVESTAESVTATDPVSVDVDVDSDGVVSFDFHIPAASTANADAAAQEARDAADACEAATSAANTAATGATTAAQNAVNATVDTVHATQDARAAITDTQAATASANTAASAANTAKDATIAATTAANSATTAATTATSNANTAATNATTATASAITAAGAANTAATDAAQAVADLQAFVPLDADNILKASETGAIVSTSDAYPSPLLGLTVYGNSVQDGTPTPETPVPIKSVAGAKACTSGKNLANFAPKSERGMTCVKNADGTVTISGTPTGDWAGFGNSIDCDLPELGPYTISITKALPYKVGCTVTADDGTTQRPSISIGSTSTTFTVSKPIKWIAFTLTSLTAGTALSAETFGFQLEQGSTATEFESASLMITPLTLIDDQGVAHELRSVVQDYTNVRIGDDLTINSDGSGSLVVKTNEVVIDGSIPPSTFYVGSNAILALFSTTSITGGINAPYYQTTHHVGMLGNRHAKYINNYYANGVTQAKQAADSAYGEGSAYTMQGNTIALFYPLGSFADKAAYVAWLAENPEKIIYQRSSGRYATYTIPAINMPSLPDLVSNAWISATDADGAAIAADIGITYRRDVNAVIDTLEGKIDQTAAMIAPVEGETASANYAIGSYLVHDSVLYKATAAIARSEAIVPGTNVTATTVMAEIAAING